MENDTNSGNETTKKSYLRNLVANLSKNNQSQTDSKKVPAFGTIVHIWQHDTQRQTPRIHRRSEGGTLGTRVTLWNRFCRIHLLPCPVSMWWCVLIIILLTILQKIDFLCRHGSIEGENVLHFLAFLGTYPLTKLKLSLLAKRHMYTR